MYKATWTRADITELILTKTLEQNECSDGEYLFYAIEFLNDVLWKMDEWNCRFVEVEFIESEFEGFMKVVPVDGSGYYQISSFNLLHSA